ncbi:hypothetical protein O0L34_g19428 [Tuta absoluta]|nr:hypothetical protein O0L34_g19428 [Tuta absoluta]
MAPCQTVKCHNCNIVICELLSYIQYKHDVMDIVSLIKLCESTFTEKEIEEAKTLLFESVKVTRAKINRRKDGKGKRNLEDIISFFKDIDPEQLPMFVAKDLQKLPPATIDHIDTVTLFKDITKIRNVLNTFRTEYATVSQLNVLKREIKIMKTEFSSNFHYTNNVNTRKRGGFGLDSGPTGLSQTFSNEEGNVAGPVMVENVDNSDNSDDGRTKNVWRKIGEQHSSSSLSHLHSQSSHESPNHDISVTQAFQAETKSTALLQGVNGPLLHGAAHAPETRAASLQNVNVNGPLLSKSNVVLEKTMAEVLKEKGDWKPENPDETWIEVQRRRVRNPFIGKTGKAAPVPDKMTGSQFKAADIRIPLFISNVNKEVEPQGICEYIESKAQVNVDVEKINMKYSRPYSAYKIFVPKHKLEMFLNDEFWPDGVKFQQFVHLKRKSAVPPEPGAGVQNEKLKD